MRAELAFHEAKEHDCETSKRQKQMTARRDGIPINPVRFKSATDQFRSANGHPLIQYIMYVRP